MRGDAEAAQAVAPRHFFDLYLCMPAMATTRKTHPFHPH